MSGRELIPVGPAVTRIGPETTFGTASGSMVTVFPRNQDTELNLQQKVIQVNNESAYMFNRQTHALGVKSESTGKISLEVQAHATQLESGAVGVTTPAHCQLIKTVFGGTNAERIVAGTTIGTVTSGTAFNVADGTKLKPMSVALFEQSAGNLELGVVQSVATNAVTMRFGLSGSPLATTGKVINLIAYHPIQNASESVTIERVEAMSTNTMKRALGSNGKLSFNFPRGELVYYDCELMVADYQEGSSLGIPTTLQTNSQVGNFAMVNAHCIFQPTGTATRGFYDLYDVKVELNTNMVPVINSAGNGVQNVIGYKRVTPEGMCFAKFTARFYYDRDLETAFDNKTQYQFGVFAYSGAGLTMRACGFYSPVVIMASKPKKVKESGLWLLEVELEAQQNTAGADEFERSPFTFYVG